MIAKDLFLKNVRAIENSAFRFQSGFNLIIGANGVGKSSVLDSLQVCLSTLVTRASGFRARVGGFGVDDIRAGADLLLVECHVEIDLAEFGYLTQVSRNDSADQGARAGWPGRQGRRSPMRSWFLGTVPTPAAVAPPTGRPLALLYSTKRAVPSERAPRKRAAAGGVAAAFAEALVNRELRLGELAMWMRVQDALRSQRAGSTKALGAFETAVVRFLPGYSNLRPDGDRPGLLIDRGDGTIPVRQMSDGERGVLALVLDLTRRLVQANPEMDDPVSNAEAVVLIDELELHLHPKWQRQIIRKLETTFPRCQFIATTHSPQVVGELAHDRIQILTENGVFWPARSFGADSSRVLEEIMEAPPRTHEVEELLAQVSREVSEQRYEKARESLADLVERLGENDPEVTRISTLLDFMEDED